MKYKVTYKLYATAEAEAEARKSLDEYNLEEGAGLEFVDTMEQEVIANDRTHLDELMFNLYRAKPEQFVSVEVLADDTKELVKDLELIDLADRQPACARYDWTTDEVLAFARDAIALHMEKLQKENS